MQALLILAGLFYNVLILYLNFKTMRLSFLLMLQGVFVNCVTFVTCKNYIIIFISQIKKAATFVADLIKKNIHILKEGNAVKNKAQARRRRNESR